MHTSEKHPPGVEFINSYGILIGALHSQIRFKMCRLLGTQLSLQRILVSLFDERIDLLGSDVQGSSYNPSSGLLTGSYQYYWSTL